jgi:hypothetical protein
MPKANPEFEAIFSALRPLLARHASRLVVVHDRPGDFYLNTARLGPTKKPMFFGAVKIGKSYVSYHLMPVYAYPELLAGIPASLLGCLQGKSSFNFTLPGTIDLTALGKLTDAGLARFRKDGLA